MPPPRNSIAAFLAQLARANAKITIRRIDQSTLTPEDKTFLKDAVRNNDFAAVRRRVDQEAQPTDAQVVWKDKPQIWITSWIT